MVEQVVSIIIIGLLDVFNLVLVLILLAVLSMAIGLPSQFSSLTCEDSGGVELSGDNNPDCLINGSGSSLFAISCFGFTLRCRLL